MAKATAAPADGDDDDKKKALRKKAKQLRDLARQAEQAAGGKVSAGGYDTHRDAMAEKSRERSAKGRELGDLPAVADPDRRAGCSRDFKRFCETYLAQWFCLAWSLDHIAALARMQECILSGGQFAFAMPRGSGKSSICDAGVLFATLNGHRQFVVLIGASEDAAKESMQTVKTEIETNDLLYADFPEVCFPVRALEGANNRAGGQTQGGARTRITWADARVTFPTIAGSAASGARVRVAGITGRIRGMKATTAGGRSIRPDLCIVDDPQTDDPLDVDTPIPTPRGFVRMGDLVVGDTVFDEHGKPCHVTAVSPVMFDRECFRVTFDDGSWVVSDSCHKWQTSTALQRTNLRRRVAKPDPGYAARPQCQPQPVASVMKTSDIASSLTAEGGRHNHSIPLAGSLQIDAAALPIPPYTLGVWLGDGDSRTGRITTADLQMLNNTRRDGFSNGEGSRAYYKAGGRESRARAYTLYGLSPMLRRLGLLSNKHIPAPYLFASPEQRLALLQGLMDTDGSVTLGRKGIKGTRCTFANTNFNLIEGVVFLCRSLGIKATCTPVRASRPNAAPLWTVNFITSLPAFGLSRKLSRLPVTTRPDTRRRYVTAVEPVASRPVRCITVDSPSHLYLCGEALIPTHNSATSPSQNAKREKILSGAILGLAGPKKKIACMMPCTVISPGDMADRILDRERHPVWQGQRCKMVISWPTDTEAWDQYADLRRSSMRAGGSGVEATEFYLAHQDEMNAGARASWDERFNTDEISAIQHAMNLKIDRGERVFNAEFQNEPLPELDGAGVEELNPDELVERVNHSPRGVIPHGSTRLTAAIDVQGNILYWTVCAWTEHFGGSVIDYGTFPRQNRDYFAATDARPSLEDVYPTHDVRERLFAGLKALTDPLLERDYRFESGDTMRVEKCIVDAGFETDTVHSACRLSRHRSTLLPAHGWGITAGGNPMPQWPARDGEQRDRNEGGYWVIRPYTGTSRGRTCVFDANFWKTFVAQRLTTPAGGRTCLWLYGDGKGEHQLYADHLAAEFWVQTTGRGRTLCEWKARLDRRDNHWLDTLVGSAVAASVLGIKSDAGAAAGEPKRKPEFRKRLTLAEKMQRRKEPRVIDTGEHH
jgi:hypothetical protein